LAPEYAVLFMVFAKSVKPPIEMRANENPASVSERSARISQRTRSRADRAAAARGAELLLAELLQARQSEAYFRALTENALDLITILEADGTIRFESRSIETELGYAPEHYRGRNAFEFVHPEDLPVVAQAFQQAVATAGNTPVISFRFLHRDGSYRILEGRGNNLLADPAVHGIVFNSRDVTEQRRLSARIEEARKDKEEVIAQLTGGVAHDFNNVLTAILGFAELTAREVPSCSTAARHLSEIAEAGKRAAQLTQQLLAFSRKQVLQPRVVHFDKVLTKLAPRLRTELGAGIQLVMPSVRDISPLRIDVEQIERVLLLLAENARDAMPAGGRLSVSCLELLLTEEELAPGSEERAGTYLQVSVADNGCGMDATTLTHIFEPFFTTKPLGKGPGLGLSTCQGIIRQSGGHLTVFSEKGRGTTVNIYLPTADGALETLPPPVCEPPPEATGTILLVDDEPMLREIGETILTGLGFHVLVAENGKDALRQIAERPNLHIDLLLTDVVMPEMDGAELATEFQRISPGSKVLFCSGYTRDALSDRGSLSSTESFLQKPYTLEGLRRKVCAALGLPT